jgi:hypothetical protein
VPEKGWLTKIAIDARAADITGDLAIDASGQGAPSRLWAGLEAPGTILGARPVDWFTVLALVALAAAGAVLIGRLSTPRASSAAG